MKAIKVVLAEREQAAAAAAEEDPERWAELRTEAEIDTGIRRQTGSEKKGRVARARPEAFVGEQTGKQASVLSFSRRWLLVLQP